MTARFKIPEIQDNIHGWGPRAVYEVRKEKAPYQPFSKGDRLGKVADWTGATYQDNRYANKYASTFANSEMIAYSYVHRDNENKYQMLVKAVPAPTNTQKRLFPQQGNRFMGNQQHQSAPKNTSSGPTRNQNSGGGGGGGHHHGGRGGGGHSGMGGQMGGNKGNKNPVNRRWNQRGNYMNMMYREASVSIKSDWKVMEEIDFARMAKLSLPSVSEPIDLYCAGAMEYYDKTFDRVTAKNEKKLVRMNRVFHKVTTTDDPIIRKLTKTDGNVFATDAVLATIMCCSRSVYSWDIVVQKIAGKLFFDKRDDSDFDLLTVNENSSDIPIDVSHSAGYLRNLSLESTFVNTNFSQQVLAKDGKKYKFDHSNPFVSKKQDEEVASVGYRYRMWNLGNSIQLVARTEHDAVQLGPNNELQFLTLKALNEWEARTGLDWRQKVDMQRGSVLANELKNNACKIAKWTVQALIAGSDFMKLGYVSRVDMRDSSRHGILGTQQLNPRDFATQITLNMDNAWGILRCIIDICMQLPNGKYTIMKDPNKAMIRLYDVPDSGSEGENDSDDDNDEKSSEKDKKKQTKGKGKQKDKKNEGGKGKSGKKRD